MEQNKTDKDCKRCGQCCEYVAIPIPQPNIMNRSVIDYCHWILAHNDMRLGRNGDNDWAVIVKSKCQYYNDVFEECSVYEDRFDVCRMFSPNNCMGNTNNPDWKIYETIKEFDEEVNPFYEK